MSKGRDKGENKRALSFFLLKNKECMMKKEKKFKRL